LLDVRGFDLSLCINIFFNKTDILAVKLVSYSLINPLKLIIYFSMAYLIWLILILKLKNTKVDIGSVYRSIY